MIEFTQAQNGKRVTICLKGGFVVVERESDRTGIRINGQPEALIVKGGYLDTKCKLCENSVEEIIKSLEKIKGK